MSAIMSDLGAPVESKRGYCYTDDQIRACAAIYASTGNLYEVERQSNIPESTMRYWIENNPVWAETLALVRAHKSDQLVSRWDKIINRSLDLVDAGLDRLDASELKANDIKSLTIAAATAQDKQRLLMGLPSRITETREDLTGMAQQFAELIAKREKTIVSDQ